MQRVEVKAGVCGFCTVVTAVKQPDGGIRIEVQSECELVRRYVDGGVTVDPIEELYGEGGRFAERRPCHATCLVPVAALKAIEAEAGLALPRDAAIRFLASE